MQRTLFVALALLATVATAQQLPYAARFVNAVNETITINSAIGDFTLAPLEVTNYTISATQNFTVSSVTINGAPVSNLQYALSITLFDIFVAEFVNNTFTFIKLSANYAAVTSNNTAYIRLVDLNSADQTIGTGAQNPTSGIFGSGTPNSAAITQYNTYLSASPYVAVNVNFTSLIVRLSTGTTATQNINLPVTLTAGNAYTVFLFGNDTTNATASFEFDAAVILQTSTTGVAGTTGLRATTGITTAAAATTGAVATSAAVATTSVTSAAGLTTSPRATTGVTSATSATSARVTSASGATTGAASALSPIFAVAAVLSAIALTF